MTTIGEQPLARFVDRQTLVHDRTYPHPIERVWAAVTTAAHVEAWLLPETRIERRLGGACTFGWGGPADGDGASHGTVSVWDPPTAVQYTFDDRSYVRFDLASLEDGRSTALAFTLWFRPGTGNEMDDDPGGDLPAGSDSAWRPGFVAGFHEMLDQLRGWLDGTWTLEHNLRELTVSATDPNGSAEHQRWIGVYREHIREHCPTA